MVFQLLYASLATKPFSDEELLAMLDQARINNSNRNITGMLLYRDGRFLQLLEGGEAAVNDLFDTIRRDPRHRAVALISSKSVQVRSFPHWSMGFENLTHWRDPALFRGAAGLCDIPFDPSYFGSNPTEAQRFILSFRGLRKPSLPIPRSA